MRVKRLLLPINPLYTGYEELPDKTQGVELQPFVFTGWDGHEVQACIVRCAEKQEEITPRQNALLESMRGVSLKELQSIDYVLVCVDWDHGIRSALPLAETLAAAGLSCVLWSPRAGEARPYCTRGLRESQDVSLLINALEQQSGRQDLLIVGVGRGFGGELMLHAAAQEPRIRALVAIDASASLSKQLKRANVSTPMREAIGWRMNQLAGLEPFDIAAVKYAGRIPRETPVMLIHLGEGIPESTLEDAVSLYTQLQSEQRRLLTLRQPEDPADASTRSVTYSHEGGTREIVQHVEAELLHDIDRLPVEILYWLGNLQASLWEDVQPTSIIPNK